MTRKKLTLADVSAKVEKMFTPDIMFTWSAGTKAYWMTYANMAAYPWWSQQLLFKDKERKLVFEEAFEKTLASAQAAGFCTEVIK